MNSDGLRDMPVVCFFQDTLDNSWVKGMKSSSAGKDHAELCDTWEPFGAQCGPAKSSASGTGK